MKDLNNQPFEEEWRRAFEGVEASPGGDVWSRLDGHLANEETKEYKRRLVWFQRIAAGVILLLLGGGTWLWLHNTSPTGSTTIAHSTQTGKSGAASVENTHGSNHIPDSTTGIPTPAERAMALRLEENSSKQTNQSKDQLVQSEQHSPDVATTQTPKPEVLANEPDLHGLPNRGVTPSAQRRNAIEQDATQNRLANTWSDKTSTSNSETKDAPLASDHKQITAPNPLSEAGPADPIANQPSSDRWSFYELSPRRIAVKEPVIRSRSIMPHLGEVYWAKVSAEEEKKESKKRDRWQIGVAFAPSTFQPNFQLNENSPAFVSRVNTLSSGFRSTGADASSLFVANRDLETATASGLSYQTGIRVEYMLSRRLSLQSGVDYLYNSSSILTNTYVWNRYNGKREPAFASILNYNNQVQAEAMVFADEQPSLINNNTEYSFKDLAQSPAEIAIQNVYEYVSIPLKVNYLVLDKKVGAMVGLGIAGDVFLNNRFGNEEAEIDEVNLASTKGTAYRSLGISAWLGVKMQYRFANKYSVFLEPSYRAAITSFTNTNALYSRPSMFGIGTGLQMRF